MNKLYLSLTVLFTILVTDLRAQNIVFNDPLFKEYLLSATDEHNVNSSGITTKNLNGDSFNMDTNNDGEISQQEALQVSYINFINEPGITDMTEIKYFPNLTYLNASAADITSIDISNLNKLINLYFTSCNELSTLDVSQNAELEILIIRKTKITNLDLSNNPKLTLFRSGYNSIETLDLSKQTQLQEASLQHLELKNLTLGDKPFLTTLYVFNNTDLTQIDLSQAPNLNRLECEFTAIKDLDLTHNPKLTFLKCFSYHLETLKVKNEDRTAPLVNDFISFYSPTLTYVCANENEIDVFKSEIPDTSSAIVDSLCDQDLSIATFDFNEEFTLSPNPAQDQITIQAHNGAAVESISIFNIQGQQVLQTNRTNIDVAHLNSGVYVVSILTDKGSTKTKFVKL